MFSTKTSRFLEGFIKTIHYCVSHLSSSKKQRAFQEIRIPVPWGHLAGKWWGPTNMRPVLSLHGWQDNCGTFDRIMPQLNEDVGFLAIDFPGHGYSSRLPLGMYYHSIDCIILIQIIVNYFQWPKISLMGHSLGGITSYVYSMLYPDNVDFVICLDAAKPMIRANNNIFMASAIQRFLKYDLFARSGKEPPSYTLEEIKQMMCKPNKDSIQYEYCHYLIERNVVQSKLHPGKHYFSRDPRLKVGGLNNFPQNELVEYAQNVTCPIFIAKAIDSSYYEPKENFYEVMDVVKRTSKDCDFHYVQGTHHVHLNNPERVAELVTKFIRRHNIENRKVGGLKEEMVVAKDEQRLDS